MKKRIPVSLLVRHLGKFPVPVYNPVSSRMEESDRNGTSWVILKNEMCGKTYINY